MKKGTKFSKRVENAVGKGEIACYEQFLLFPLCFQKTCTADTFKPGLVFKVLTDQDLNQSLSLALETIMICVIRLESHII